MEFIHKPVLLNECIDNLNIKEAGIYLDGTLGGAGHSLEIAKLLNEKATLIGVDRDIEAINVSKKRLEGVKPTVKLVNDNYKNIKSILSDIGVKKVDGILLDLGVSSYQLDNPDRGFSYRYDAPLDMRMSSNDKLTASMVVNEYTKDKLIEIFRKYGEEKWSVRIAEFIVEKRKSVPILTTFELVDIIKAAVPVGARIEGGHPAKRIFQAIRIEVNGEIESLKNAVKDAIDCLAIGGRICIISFHSLEDRIVKEVFNELARGCTCPPDFPKCVCNNKKVIKILTKKPITSTDVELSENNRAHSAKLRVAERIYDC